MEEHSLYTHYLSCRRDVPDRELSENTKKIIALVESEDFLEANKYGLSNMYVLMKIVLSARADIRYKRELLKGIMEEFKDTNDWKYDGEVYFMEEYEPFCIAVDLMNSADNVSFTLTKVTRDENNSRSYYDDYPKFSSVEEISRYLESRFDETKDSEDDPEWYIVKRHGDGNIKKPSLLEWRMEWNEKQRREYIVKLSVTYLLSKRGTVWKCGFGKNYEEDAIGWEIDDGQRLANYGDIVVFDRRPFYDICHMIYANDGCEDTGLYVENGKLKTFPLEYHVTGFEEFAFELRVCVQEDMSRLSEQERVLQLIQQKYLSMNGKDGWEFLEDITGTDGMSIEEVTEKFLK